ncbi:CGNR zinc finger domain-containing protein [Streptomyces sp. ISL-43]|uniref:CGNR zinc finger domain-containing protein n=1 Tax=Streptomyces sp. ISL-43 TaxID=2819183 RepID=UPI001BE6A4CD|nr:CGNR zinc finger domain-containing protein [Streptomyces sp. ISL-43]MBT2447923.1 CGNR zinc finger domain-containing protein [Streptomyces sp. ISL-43]
MSDPRPLTGEPLSLDLLNTLWHDRHGRYDLLDSLAGLELWLSGSRAAALYGRGELRADPATLAAAREARAALAGVVGGGRTARGAGGAGSVAAAGRGPEAVAFDAFNRLLDGGRIRRLLTPAGPVERLEAVDPARLLGYLAAADYLRLLTTAPDRLKSCANPTCGLRFHDASRNGTRRWCSSTGCGNRAKAARHYARRTARVP